MPYEWARFLHVLAAIGFVAAHGAAFVVVFAIRRSQERSRLLAILDFSGRTTLAMYVSLASVVVTGLWMGFLRTDLFERRWYWLSLAVLVVVTVFMVMIAKPFTERLRAATEMRPSGVPRRSDEEIGEMVRSPRVEAISLVGFVGLVGILYLMVFQPGLGESRAIVVIPTTTTSASPATTVPPGATTTLSDEEALLATGKELFDATAGGVGCAACHGSDGAGTSYGSDIRGASRQDIVSAIEWAGPMSGIELSEEELDAVSFYLSRLP